MNAIETLISVLCDSEGKCCISGSDDDRRLIDSALADLAAAPAQPAAQQGLAQQEAQEPATVPRFNCWSTNEGDSWFDHPADSQAIYDCLGNDAKVGDEYELTAGWKSVTARYRITEVVGDGEEYEVECISHPHENSAPHPSPTPQADSVQEDTARLDWLLLRISGAEFRRLGVHYSGNARRADVDAARKQGVSHDR